MNIPHYDQINYNEAIYHLEQEWNRKLTEHEVNILKFGYRFGRYIQMEDSYIVEAVKCNKNTF